MNELIKEGINSSPLTLIPFYSKNKDLINNVLPFSTGFEIECHQKPGFNDNFFKQIPDIMEVICDTSEQRFRIPNGLRGLICLYNISELLKQYSYFNPLSGIHYHIDCTDWYHQLEDTRHEHKDKVLKELESWGYNSSYNSKDIGYSHYWIRLNNQFKTAEFRIGEMTFDYPLLVKRIIHANAIMLEWKLKEVENFTLSDIVYEDINKELILNYAKNKSVYFNENNIQDRINKINSLYETVPPVVKELTSEERMKEIIKQRQIKL